ncbi:recombinase family protein [Bacillus sp. UNCCL81]|uniref:recombinase family protein n=1 Tax=Bacillus sp. UNCCL81 TaxID=1502755 RepID=UPI0008F089C7|nr:recombinase family protein [Bacillus sp. UNCCL81]SFD44914.1 site-specific DNA recombinase [Bacillus sp. UNCCL81]
MKTAIYVRVSTEEQAQEGYSIQAQKNRLQAYCDSQDWEIVGFYVDEGISAKNMERPELIRMNEHIEMGLIECVLVFRLDRLTRSVLDLYKLLEHFDKHDCKFKSATEVYDTTTAMGRLFITIVAALAQWERENTGERIKIGLEEKVRQGKYAAHVKPFGYSLDNATGELTIIPEEAKVVQKIYNQYLEGLSTNKICLNMIKDNAPGIVWNDNAIFRIIRNPLYKGSLWWGKNTENYFEVDKAVPAIIPEEVWDKVQLHIDMRKPKHPRQATSDYVFSGTLRCGICGRALVGSKITSTIKTGKKTYKNYRCRARYFKECNMNVSDKIVEALFLDYVGNIKYYDEVNETMNQVSSSLDSTPILDERAEIEQELKSIVKRRKKWQFAWANDHINDKEFTERMKEENDKEKYLKEKLSNVATPIELHSNEEIQEILLNIKENWYDMTDYEKKTLVNILVKSFVVVRKPGKKTRYEFFIESIEFN